MRSQKSLRVPSETKHEELIQEELTVRPAFILDEMIEHRGDSSEVIMNHAKDLTSKTKKGWLLMSTTR